jgi:transmembrane sensor
MSVPPDRPYEAAQAPDWDALARYLDGESDAAESQRVRAWLEAHPGDAALISTLDSHVGRAAFGSQAARADAEAEVDVVAALQRVKDRQRVASEVVPLASRRRWRTPVLAAAAALFLIAALTMFRPRSSDIEAPMGAEPDYVSVSETGTGQRDSLRLPDGSLAVLGPQSSLVVRTFTDEMRLVELEGEGYFEVQHQANRPFIVRAGLASVRDIGTAFTVRTDSTRDVTRVTVTEGSVELRRSTDSTGRGLLLVRGDVGVLRDAGRPELLRGAVTPADTAWLHGRLLFRDTPLVAVAGELRRWYGVDVRIDSAFAGRHFNGTYANDPVDRVLGDLALSFGARLERRGNTATIRPH